MARDGLDGLDGLSPYELAQASGFRGSLAEWLASLKGEPGHDGKSVELDAVQALVMRAVDQIPRPKDGDKGEPGRDGKDGVDGLRGKDGLAGKDGADAVLPALANWRAWFERDEETRLTTRVTAGPTNGLPIVELVPTRDADELIVYVDLMPLA